MADANTNLPNTVKLFSPEGELYAVPASEAQQAQALGYRAASEQQAQSYLDEQKFGSTGQQAITAIEGAGRGATFGLSSAVERGLGVNPEDIRKRQEVNPASSMIGEGAGIVGYSLIPVAGAANIAGHIGEGAASLAAHAIPALGEANMIGKVGSAAVKGAIENAVFAGGDEVSKAILQDPNQSLQTAVTDIGLSALIGGGASGAFGAVSPLWEATAGPKAKEFLEAIQNRANGVELPQSGATSNVERILGERGVQIPDEFRAALSGNDKFSTTLNNILDSGTHSGDSTREIHEKLVDALHEEIRNQFDSSGALTSHEAGDQAKQQILSSAEEAYAPVRAAQDQIKQETEQLNSHLSKLFDTSGRLSDHESGEILKQKMLSKEQELYQPLKEGYARQEAYNKTIEIPDTEKKKFFDSMVDESQKFASSGGGTQHGPGEKLLREVATHVSAQDNVHQLNTIVSDLGKKSQALMRAGEGESSQAAKKAKALVEQYRDSQIKLAAKDSGSAQFNTVSGEHIAEKQTTDAGYKEFKNTLSELAGAGKLGKADTDLKFRQAIEKVPSARLADRMFDVKNIKLLGTLETKFPEMFELLARQKRLEIFGKVAKDGVVDTKKFFKEFYNLPQEVRSKLFSSADLESISHAGARLEALDKGVGSLGKEAVAKSEAFAKLAKDVSSAGKLGKIESVEDLKAAFDKVPSSTLAKNLLSKERVESMRFLRDNFPDVFETLAKQRRSDILHNAITGKGAFSTPRLFQQIDDLPKEIRESIFPKEMLQNLQDLRTTLRDLPGGENNSRTARTLDKQNGWMPMGGSAIASMLMGHNPIVGGILGHAGRLLTRDFPDAAKLSLLKFLGSSGPVDASAWKATADVIEKIYRGQSLIERSSKAVFQAGKAVLPDALYPDEKKVQRLDKKLKDLAQNPEPLFDIGGKTGHYMPETAQAMGETAANAVTWLNNQRPKEPQLGILDAKAPIPKEVSDHFNRTLQIAEQPLVALQHLKDGTLQPADVQTVQTLYPQLYQKLTSQLTSELIDHKSKDGSIPYKTVLGLSMFLAQPLDGTMTPQGIQGIQAALSSSNQAGPSTQPGAHRSLKAMSEQPSREMTPGQSRESSHQA